MLNLIDFARSLIFAIIFGSMENRLFFEKEDGYIMTKRGIFWRYEKHFKLYHLFLFFTYVTIGFSTNLATWLLDVFAIMLVEDLSYWLLERIQYNRKPKREDWDNFGELPLVLGGFAWWWIFLAIITILMVIA